MSYAIANKYNVCQAITHLLLWNAKWAAFFFSILADIIYTLRNNRFREK